MDPRFERYIEDLRTVRALSQPKFSPDMKAKELLETIQSNACLLNTSDAADD